MDADGTFDIAGFKHAVEVVFTAQEVIVGNSSYPTEKIERNAKAFRQLGLGYANLGALLMARGLPYDSDGGRAWAGAITALMTGHAYRTSARIAEQMGPFAAAMQGGGMPGMPGGGGLNLPGGLDLSGLGLGGPAPHHEDPDDEDKPKT